MATKVRPIRINTSNLPIAGQVVCYSSDDEFVYKTFGEANRFTWNLSTDTFTIVNTKCTINSFVAITPTSTPNGRISVDPGAGSFDVHTSAGDELGITFKYYLYY